jgi:hypothetical protein
VRDLPLPEVDTGIVPTDAQRDAARDLAKTLGLGGSMDRVLAALG